MLKTLRAGALAFAALCLAPFAAHAACPTAPTYTTLSGLDAASATKSMQMYNGGSGFLATPLLHGWNGSAMVALTADANCNLQTAPVADELHHGEVGGNILPITVAQTVTASSAYSTGNAVGGLMTLANAVRVSGSLGASGTSGMIQGVVANLKSAQTGQIDVFFFKANPSGSTCTDKTAFVLATADFDKVIGVAHINDWTAGNVASLGQAQSLAMPFAVASATSIYACAVTRAGPTFTATSDVSITAEILRN